MALPTVDMLEKRLAERASAVKRLLASEDGALLLEALEEQFLFGSLIGPTDRETFVNIGAREVVLFLRDMRNAAEGE